MRARVDQDGHEPGAEVRVYATLSEFGQPVAGRARAIAEIRRPDGLTSKLDLDEEAPGAFTIAFKAGQVGVYRIRLLARGRTLRGASFTREQILTAGVARGADAAPRPTEDAGSVVSDVLRCLAKKGDVRSWAEERGVSIEDLVRCLGRDPDKEALNRMG